MDLMLTGRSCLLPREKRKEKVEEIQSEGFYVGVRRAYIMRYLVCAVVCLPSAPSINNELFACAAGIAPFYTPFSLSFLNLDSFQCFNSRRATYIPDFNVKYLLS